MGEPMAKDKSKKHDEAPGEERVEPKKQALKSYNASDKKLGTLVETAAVGESIHICL